MKRLEEDRTSPGRIAISDRAAEVPTHAKMVAAGKGKILENKNVRPCDVKVGDNTIFGKYSGTEVRVEGEDPAVMREEDVMAVIESKYLEDHDHDGEGSKIQRRRASAHA